MDNLKLIVGLTLGASAALGFLLTFIGSKLGKHGAAIGAILATTVAVVVACRPLVGSWPVWPTGDALFRGVWAVIPLGGISIFLSLKKVPVWVQCMVVALAAGGALVWIFALYSPPSGTTRTIFLLEWVGIATAVVLMVWLLIEPIATRRSAVGGAVTVGFIALGIGSLYLNSSSTRSGTMVGCVGAVVGGVTVAGVVSRKIFSGNSPVFLWVALLAVFYAPSAYDSDMIPCRLLAMILSVPLLAWVVELPWINRLKPWKKELLRGVLVAAPVLTAAALGYNQHAKEAKESGDEYGLLDHFAAPRWPRYIPIANTIIPPTMT